MSACIASVTAPLRLLLAASGSGHVDMASNQVKLLRPRMGREIGQEQLTTERERGRERKREREQQRDEAGQREPQFGFTLSGAAHGAEHPAELPSLLCHHKPGFSLFVDWDGAGLT